MSLHTIFLLFTAMALNCSY